MKTILLTQGREFKTLKAFCKIFNAKSSQQAEVILTDDKRLRVISISDDNLYGWDNNVIDINGKYGAYVTWYNKDTSKLECTINRFSSESGNKYILIKKDAAGKPYKLLGVYEYDKNAKSVRKEVRWRRTSRIIEIGKSDDGKVISINIKDQSPIRA